MSSGTPSDLSRVLQDLSQHEFPVVDCPSGLDKRASVALIIRINPIHPDPAVFPTLPVTDTKERVGAFFEQPWVTRGNAEVLFIKRAARKGDRWQGHVALPGGRRDPEDLSDKHAAVRETLEEVGIDLSEDKCIHVGNLPQRLVTTSWGKVPLMVLCPYVFLLIDPNPQQSLQPTEIASTHWVPIQALLSSSLRTFEEQDVSSRLAKQEFGVKRWFLRAMLGKMIFSAIRLTPSESRYCTSVPGFIPESKNAKAPTAPLLLWGLTLGVVADFLDLIPPHDALALWSYPTFSPPDVRFIIWALSYTFRKRKHEEVQSGRLHSPAGIELGLDAINPNNDAGTESQRPEAGISGVSVGSRMWINSSGQHGFNSSAIGTMLEGYYDIVRRAVAAALITRCAAVVSVLSIAWMRRKGRI